MICVIQRVNHCKVLINKELISKINNGMLIFIGIESKDSKSDIEYVVKKTSNLRIFSDEKNKMNLSIKEINGEILMC